MTVEEESLPFSEVIKNINVDLDIQTDLILLLFKGQTSFGFEIKETVMEKKKKKAKVTFIFDSCFVDFINSMQYFIFYFAIW